MPKRWLVLFAAAMTGLLGCASQPDGPVGTTSRAISSASALKGGPLEVTSAQFGVFGADSEGHRILFETDRFPAVTAAPYGWYIIFKTNKPTVVWREEFELPEAPPSWGPGEALGIYTISPDRKTAVTERVIPTRLGFIANEWRYAPGDPIGAHAMRVYIDGQLVREFKFNIEDGPGRGRSPGRGPTT
jgi:hypothetical protein